VDKYKNGSFSISAFCLYNLFALLRRLNCNVPEENLDKTLANKLMICYIIGIQETTAHKMGWPNYRDRKIHPASGQSFGVVFLCMATYKR